MRKNKYGESKYLKKEDLKELTVLDSSQNIEKLKEVTAIVLDKFLAKVAFSPDYDGRDVSAIERLSNAVSKIEDNTRKQELHDKEFGQDLDKEQILALMAEQFALLSEEDKHKIAIMADQLKIEEGV
jgi:ribosomal protein S7